MLRNKNRRFDKNKGKNVKIRIINRSARMLRTKYIKEIKS